MIKRILALLLAALLLLSLSSCGPEPGVTVLDPSQTNPEYLSFFSNVSLSSSDVVKYWSDLFTETYHNRVYVNFESAAYYADEGLSYRELLVKRLESGSPDDIYIINAEDVLEFEKHGYWLDLSDMDFVDNLSDAALYQSTYNGKVFSLPLSFTGFGLTWNVDMLSEHGLTVPGNLSEFMNVCETLHSNGILPYGANKGFALTVPAMCVGLAELYGSDDLDVRLTSLNSGETPISHYLRDGFSFLATMIEKGYMNPEQALSSTPSIDDVALFSSGECAFICTSLGDLSGLQSLPFEINLTGLPVLENGSISVYGADKRLCINPESAHLETALRFIEMVGTTQALDASAALSNVMSSARNSDNTWLPPEGLISLLSQPGQIPNQDFSLKFNTWESIRNVAREICAGISVEQACSMLDEMQRADLLSYAG